MDNFIKILIVILLCIPAIMTLGYLVDLYIIALPQTFLHGCLGIFFLGWCIIIPLLMFRTD